MARRNRRAARPSLAPLPSLAAVPPEIRLANHSAMRAEWGDPEDTMPNASRTARTIHGYRGYCPLRWCLRRHGERSSFTARLRGLFDGARLGFSGLRDWRPVQSIAYRPSLGPASPALRQLKCRRQFDQVWSLFTDPVRAALDLVLLQNMAVGPAAEQLGINRPLLTQRLVEALDRLCLHWDIPTERRAA